MKRGPSDRVSRWIGLATYLVGLVDVATGVTTVHTGEFWAGPLPIVLMVGMGLAGLLLIGRRRVASLTRSLTSSNRRRGGS